MFKQLSIGSRQVLSRLILLTALPGFIGLLTVLSAWLPLTSGPGPCRHDRLSTERRGFNAQFTGNAGTRLSPAAGAIRFADAGSDGCTLRS
jgi:hypothetical protein